ncbi:contractile injection system protein, VgrG/Pvc8 family [Erythrobacter sp. EC-HK427]|uniref:contractile injection system protein, VgrG/Pvc8 family n=1 Tax=Erythrobacter sp. EC-HK427 TaxID=2038396 RepID=UPI001259FAAA|nr:contractile injection system protein, VgrG/Pvc8 family [Erythrobacter sp. EC-HK427]VVT07254.1 Hypothecal protein [Erythrobacter sp. EC-HK427]
MTARKAGITLELENGTSLAAIISERLIDATLTESREAEADEVEIRLQNTDGLLAVPETGAVISLGMGWESGHDVAVGLVDKGSFTVDEVAEEGPPDTVILVGRSADLTGDLRQRRTQSWRDTTLGAILDAIAQRHGRSAKVAPELASQAIEVIEQEGKSDMAFVRDLGVRYDAISTWKNQLLLFLPIASSSTAGGTPLDAITLTKAKGWRWTFSQADRGNYDGAEAQWQDQDAGRRRTVQVGGENRRRLPRVYASEAEARQAAEAEMSRSARAPYTFTYELAIADPALQPDMRVTLQGWSERVDAVEWLVKTVKTTFGSNGLQQSLELESA